MTCPVDEDGRPHCPAIEDLLTRFEDRINVKLAEINQEVTSIRSVLLGGLDGSTGLLEAYRHLATEVAGVQSSLQTMHDEQRQRTKTVMHKAWEFLAALVVGVVGAIVGVMVQTRPPQP